VHFHLRVNVNQDHHDDACGDHDHLRQKHLAHLRDVGASVLKVVPST
jgi:hypothetical protein